MKNKNIYITLIIACLLSIFCMIMIFIPNHHYHYSGEIFISDSMESATRTIYKNIPLPRGIYDVGLEYDSEADGINSCTIVDSTMYDQKLKTNGELLIQGCSETSFRMWLLGNSENLEVQVYYGGEGNLSIEGIYFHETNAVWTILLSIIWGFTGVMVGVMLLKRSSRITNARKKSIIGILLLILLSSLPCLYNGNVNGINLIGQLEQIEIIKTGILSGTIQMLVQPSLYIPASLRALGYTVTTSYNIYCIFLNIITILLSYYCFSKMFKSEKIGLFCSALYTLSIYRIYTFYILAEVGESGAFVFFPLVFYELYRLFSEKINDRNYKKIWISLAVGYAGLIQTHMLSFIFSLMTTFVIILAILVKKVEKVRIVEIMKGTLFAILLSVWHILPWLDYYAENGYFILNPAPNSIQEKGIYLPQLFLNWWRLGNNATWNENGMRFSQPVGVGFIFGSTFFLFIILWFSGKLREKQSIISFSKLITIIAGVAMFASLNFFPWDRIQKIHPIFHKMIGVIERPDVFLGIATVSLVIVVGCLLHYFSGERGKQYMDLLYGCILITIITSSLYLIDFICRDHSFVCIFSNEGINVDGIVLSDIELSKPILWHISGLVSFVCWIFAIVVVIRKKIIIPKEKRRKNDAISDKKI